MSVLHRVVQVEVIEDDKAGMTGFHLTALTPEINY